MNDDLEFIEKFSGDILATREHFHYHNEIIFVIDGTIVMEIEERVVSISSHQICIICMTERHKVLKVSERCHRYILRFSSMFLSTLIRNTALGAIFLTSDMVEAKLFSIHTSLVASIEQSFQSIQRELTDMEVLYMERCSCLVHSVLIELYRTNMQLFGDTSHDIKRKIIEVQYYIASHFSEALSLEQLASMFAMSPFYLSRQFKHVVGVGLKDFCNQVRFAEAKRLLCTTNLPVSTICERVGMNDCNHFIRAFKAQEKITPLQYRKEFRLIGRI